MRRIFVTLVTLLALVGASCGSDEVATGGELPPTPEPAPTVEGIVLEPDEPEVQAEIVFVGLSADQTVQLHALPGIDQPLAGDVAPGTRIEKMTEE